MPAEFQRHHDVYVVNEGRVDWQAGCLSCDWQRFGFMTLTDAEDAADEHAQTPPRDVA